MQSHSDRDAVRQLQPFAAASKDSMAALLAHATVHDFAANSVLWRVGDHPKYLYVLLEGFIGFKANGRRGNDYIVDFAGPGDSFVLASVVLDRPHFLMAQVLRDSRILMIPAGAFRDCVRRDVGLSFAVSQRLAEQRMRLAVHVKGLKTQSPLERLAAFLVSLTDVREGETMISLPCERQMIAAWLGVVPSSVSRGFRVLERSCGVEGRGDRIRVRDMKRLVACAGGSPLETAAAAL